MTQSAEPKNQSSCGLDKNDGKKSSKQSAGATSKEAPHGVCASIVRDTTDNPDLVTRKTLPSLFLIREKQVDTELKHWLLAVADPEASGTYNTRIFQVTGDVEYMVYAPGLREDVFTSDSYFDSYRLTSDITHHGLEKIARIAKDVMPPWARSSKEAWENDQHWTVRVVTRLVEEGIVEKGKIKEMEGMLQPVHL